LKLVKSFGLTQKVGELKVRIAEAVSVCREPTKQWIQIGHCMVEVVTQPGNAGDGPPDTYVNHVIVSGSHAVEKG
jgi:hypothetical protein